MGTSRQSGFTVVELMVVVTIMAVLLAIAVPSFEGVINSNRLAGAANEMIASIQTARMQSMLRNRRAVVCVSANPNVATPSCSTASPIGWITFLDVDDSSHYNAGDTLLRTTLLPPSVKVLWSPNTAGKLIFRSDGLARDNTGGVLDTSKLLNATVDVCIATKRPSENVRHVNLGFGSAVSTSRENLAASCSTSPANYAP